MTFLANTLNKAVWRILAVLLFAAPATTSIFAQSTWTGGAGTTNWNTSANWTGGVPAAGKTVTIYTCNVCPVITTTGNEAAFVQVYAGGKLTISSGGSLKISNLGGPGMKTHATSQITINQGGSLLVQNFWGEGLAIGGSFQNGGNINLNGGHTGIAISAGATLTNAATGNIGVTGASLNYGLTTSGTLTNLGTLSLDDANNDGISQYAGNISLGGTVNITKTGVNAIFTKGNITNNGLLNIDNGLNGLYLLNGVFNNNAGGKMTISGSTFLNDGIYLDPGTFNNYGELLIKNALSKGMEISSASTFNNFNKMTLDVPALYGIFNVGGSNFTNKPCAIIESNKQVTNYATFTNNGIIVGAQGGGTITVNNGTLIGGFAVGSGNAAIMDANAKVWTGCSSTNWTDMKNWYPNGAPVVFAGAKVIIQSIAQASGNAPVVSSSISSPPLYLQKNASLTIANGGTLTLSDGYLGNGYLEVGQAATMTVQAGGTVNSSGYSIASGNLVNSGIINVIAPFHSAGSFGVNGGNVTNNAGGQLFGTVGQYGSGVPLGLTNNAVFTNFGSVSLSGFGSINLDHSSLTNKQGGTIVLGSGPGQGSISNANGATFLNQGSIWSGDLKTYNSSFTNSGTVNLGSKTPSLYGEGATYANSGSMTLTSGNALFYGGSFNNSGSIQIDNPNENGFVNGTQFTNSGSLKIQFTTPFTQYHGVMILNGASFKNEATGTVLTKNISHGLINWGTFSNWGTYQVEGATWRAIEHNSFSNSPFRNEITGKIIINGAANIGFAVFQTPLINAGQIEISNTAADGLSLSAPFENLATGSVVINKAGNYGLICWNNVKNYGTFVMSNCYYEGLSQKTGTFENFASGAIHVNQNQNSIWAGMEVHSMMYNYGSFDLLGDNFSSIFVGASATLVNRPCAVMNTNGFILNYGTLKNEGLLKNTHQNAQISTGTFTNTGVIEDFYNAFGSTAITNNGVRVRPIAGTIGGIIQNALEIGGTPLFVFGTTWYKNANLTDPAGSYVNGLNTFTPTTGVGSQTLYFTAKDLVNNCTKTVSIQVNIANALKGFGEKSAPAVLLSNYPNPFSDNTLIQFSVPSDTEGKLVVYDAMGRMVEVVYEGEIIKDELYQFGFDGSNKRVGNYMAVLVLKSGRTFTIQMVKADNH